MDMIGEPSNVIQAGGRASKEKRRLLKGRSRSYRGKCVKERKPISEAKESKT